MTLWETLQHNDFTLDDFIEEVFELAFGDDAINKGFSVDDVLNELRSFSDKALEAET